MSSLRDAVVRPQPPHRTSAASHVVSTLMSTDTLATSLRAAAPADGANPEQRVQVVRAVKSCRKS